MPSLLLPTIMASKLLSPTSPTSPDSGATTSAAGNAAMALKAGLNVGGVVGMGVALVGVIAGAVLVL